MTGKFELSLEESLNGALSMGPQHEAHRATIMKVSDGQSNPVFQWSNLAGQSWTLTYLPNYPCKDMTFAVGEESPYYTYGYILAKANVNEGKVVFQGPWMEPYKKVQQFSSNTILDARFHPGNSADNRHPTVSKWRSE